MLRAELRYDLPPELIAQQPIEPRDASRLLVLHRDSGQIEHRVFRDIGQYVHSGDCLVLNNTRVLPARFACRRRSGGRIEALFLTNDPSGWRVLLRPSVRLRVGELLACDGADIDLRIVEALERGEWRVAPLPAIEPATLLGKIGRTPLPPYIRRANDAAGDAEAVDRERYQTVYARKDGAAAAPTAGLHFTPELLRSLATAGVSRSEVTLHVGLATFAAIDAADLRDHRMHGEAYEVSAEAARQLRHTRLSGGRLVAVGTTSARVLESLPAIARRSDDGAARDNQPADVRGSTSIFIYPPYSFRNVDVLITNFHLPGSTLLALVMGFAGVEQTRRAYLEAVQQRYRFFSYGDAMLIL
ncbi:MAG: tRNA preQ1(34) S-adenosylmethionine ribosyltransferase-isomerase QueA [Phycisphaerae bacterium]